MDTTLIKYASTIVAALCIWLAAACRQENSSVNPTDGNFSFVLLNAQGDPIITSPSDQLNLFYFNNNQQQLIGKGTQTIRRFDQSTPYPYYYSAYIWIALAKNNTNTFYLESNNDIDTVYFDKESSPAGEGYSVKEILFNGKPVTIDETLQPPVYVFRK